MNKHMYSIDKICKTFKKTGIPYSRSGLYGLVRRSGVTGIKVGKKKYYSAEDIEKMLDMSQHNLTTTRHQEIMQCFNGTKPFKRSIVKRSEELEREIVEFYKTHRQEDTAVRFGVSHSVVSQLAKKYGIKKNNHGLEEKKNTAQKPSILTAQLKIQLNDIITLLEKNGYRITHQDTVEA